jgi:septum formation protein
MQTNNIVLASSSPYRRQLLQKLGLEFSWAAPAIDESPNPGESPTKLVLRLAEQKAKVLSKDYPSHVIIGSDQVATLDNQIIGKPHTHEAATSQLEAFNNREITFLTSICIYNSRTGRAQMGIDSYKVKFRKLTRIQIETYLLKEKPYDCAGSFKSEGLGICLFEKLEGKDPNTLIGLPLIELTKMLIEEGIDPLCN